MRAYELRAGDRIRHHGHQWPDAILYGTASVELIPHEEGWRPDRTVDIVVRLDKRDVPTFANWDTAHIALAIHQEPPT